MRILLAALAIVIATPALAISDAEQAQIYRGLANLQANLNAQKEYHLQRDKERSAAIANRCAKLGDAAVGMDAVAVGRSCWGHPLRVNTTTTASHTREQWVYAGGYLYLEDGVVTSIQTSR